MIQLSQQRLRRATLNTAYKRFICFLLCLHSGLLIFAQDILTAEKYFDTISSQYGNIEDYQANIVITQEEATMEGVLYFKQPDLMRINFTTPEEQVLAIDGKALTIYIPKYSVIMHQPLKEKSSSSVATMASEGGLELLKNNYSVAYAVGPDPVPLDSGESSDEESSLPPPIEPSDEMVVKLKLTWRTTNEGFRELKIAVGENGLIRRIIGVTVDYEEIRFDFKDILINQDIPEARFEYESPASANIFDNFLFEPDY